MTVEHNKTHKIFKFFGPQSLAFFVLYLLLTSSLAFAGQIRLHNSYNLFGPLHPGFTFTPTAGCSWPDTANTSWTESFDFGNPSPEVVSATLLVVWQPPARLAGDTSTPLWVNVLAWSYDSQGVVIGPFAQSFVAQPTPGSGGPIPTGLDMTAAMQQLRATGHQWYISAQFCGGDGTKQLTLWLTRLSIEWGITTP
jgi:hypothetical protein